MRVRHAFMGLDMGLGMRLDMHQKGVMDICAHLIGQIA